MLTLPQLWSAPNLGIASSMMALRAEKGRLLCGEPEAVLLPLDSASPVLQLEPSAGSDKHRGCQTS